MGERGSGRGLVPFSAWRERVRELANSSDGPSHMMVRRVVERADRILARLEGTSDVLDRAARLELRILEKLEPIVDDLGKLVKLQLAQALGRPRDVGRDPDQDEIIDVTE